jgi:large subunit ribosomal protein L22
MTVISSEPIASASAKHIRFSAFKVREVLDLIRGQQAEVALGILENTNRGSAGMVKKILVAALANAQSRQGFEAMELYVLECYADEGMTIKRFRPRARGRASRIRKRTCHITISLARLSDEELTKIRERKNAELTAKRQRRVKAAQESGADKQIDDLSLAKEGSDTTEEVTESSANVDNSENVSNTEEVEIDDLESSVKAEKETETELEEETTGKNIEVTKTTDDNDTVENESSDVVVDNTDLTTTELDDAELDDAEKED